MKYKAIKSDTGYLIQTPEKPTVEPVLITKPVPVTQSEEYDTNFLKINRESVLQGIIWSEILKKPKSLRRGR